MEKLSEREKLILQLIAKGTDNEDIGKTLFISIHTVKAHIANILIKMNVKNRTEAAFIAGKYKLVD